MRLWNSSTPLFSQYRRGIGGCYYLIWNNKGIIIDPGFDFVKVFGNQARTIEDIDAVVVTHDHPDHSDGISDILTVLHEFNESKKNPHKINFVVSRGTYSKFSNIFGKKWLKDSVTRLIPKTTCSILPNIYLSTIENKHKEICCRSNGLGIRFLLSNSSTSYSFGITSDTGYFPALSDFYDGIEMLIAHIGTLEDFNKKQLMNNHLGFRGIVFLLKSMKNPPSLVFVSEWGEELHGMRKTISKYLEKYSSTHVLPTDLSLVLSIPNNEIYIEQDGRFAPAKETEVLSDYGDRLRYAAQ